tara:strand:- start:444 stop:1526 length:1083 start_codon:yes stop_codon:yes gene_type:complete
MNNPKKQNHNILQSYQIDEDTISLTDIMLIIARHLKIIIITPLIFCILMILNVLFLVAPTYTSTAKIMSSSGGNNISQAAGFAAQFGINIPTGQTETKWVYTEIITSRSLAKVLLQRKFDTKEFGLQKSLLQILTYGNRNPETPLDKLEVVAVDDFLKMVDVSEDIATGIFTLKVHASEPSLASELNQALIDELDAHQRKYNKTKTIDAKKFIEDRIIDTEKELMSAEEDLKVFLDRNRRIENSPALRLEEQRLSREVTVLTGVFTTLKQQLEKTKIEEVKESDYVIVLDPPEIPHKISKPNRRRMVILAGILGIGLGLFIAFVREFFTNSDKEVLEKISEAKILVSKNFKELFQMKTKK